ncbi:MAG: serine/threonine protein kinase [Gammaproteobacteria bacterium]|nr:serine/threonine protein kinase [Gammaproteobacteria bacterium]
MNKAKNRLPNATKLDNYVIEKMLGGGGFSLVYLALDKKSGKKTVIKEYMPSKIAYRTAGLNIEPIEESNRDALVQGRKSFFKEASILAKMKHPNIVHVINFFQANGTVYMVMDYEEGANLQAYIKARGSLTEIFIRTVFPQLLKGLDAIHSRGLLHLDIKPGNIHLRPGGRPLLFDFGAVHQISQSRKNQESQVVTPGFSPIEQYNLKGYVGPWTDIYAIGATMRACIEGTSPVAANTRLERDTLRPASVAFKKRYSAPLLEAIDWAMEVDPLLRPQKVSEYLEIFDKEYTIVDGSETALDKFVNNFPWIK